jgi:hypothetical protein
VHQNDTPPQGMMNAAVQPEAQLAIPAVSTPATAMLKKPPSPTLAKGNN